MRGGAARIAAALIAAAVLAGLSACGFRPVYGVPEATALSGISVSASGEDRLSFLVGNALREQAGPGDSPYRITVRTLVRERGLGRAGDGRATRFALQVTALYTLARVDGVSAPPISGRLTERVIFEAPQDPFALLAARSQAEQRAAEVLGLAIMRDAGIALRQARDTPQEP
jgi:LPS-assembly lipoprotein